MIPYCLLVAEGGGGGELLAVGTKLILIYKCNFVCHSNGAFVYLQE